MNLGANPGGRKDSREIRGKGTEVRFVKIHYMYYEVLKQIKLN